MRAVVTFSLLALSLSSGAWAGEGGGGQETQNWHRSVALLQYLASDYPAAVESGSKAELEEQASFMEEAAAGVEALGPPAHAFLPRLQAVQQRVQRGEDPAGVRRDCEQLAADLVMAGGLTRSPRHTPNLQEGEKLYAVACAACHGMDGKAATPVAQTLSPPPANFQSGRMDALIPYKVFNVATFGVTGTAMPSFSTLTEDERWSLAFYLFTLRQPPCDHAPPRVSLEQLATSNDAELTQRFGVKELSCLRKRLSPPDAEASLLLARNGITSAMQLAKTGQALAARNAVLDAYLLGIEPIEPVLRTRSPALVARLEASFLATRLAAEKGSPHIQDEGRELLGLLDQARRAQSEAPSFWSVFWLAFFILVREGFEATVVIAALLAVLKKMETPEHRRVIHAGWTLALGVGAVAFLFGRKLLLGGNRELVEGVVSLAAVVMLLYAALWLNARANIRKFMGELRERVQGAIGRGSLASLFFIAFSSVLRESFETALFLQGLNADSAAGTSWGAGAGLGALLALVVFIRHVGYRLPMKPLFNASTVLLVATAVLLVGKGLHALQETGLLPLRPLGTLQIDFLGVYPDAVSLLPQIALAAIPLLYWVVTRRPTPLGPNASSATRPAEE